MKWSVCDRVEFVLRLVLSGVFVVAGGLKALNPEQFWVDVQNFQILPHWGNVAVALYLPYVEILCGVGVWHRRWGLGALGLIAGMMGVFIVALGSAWWRGLDITCGCFGGGGAKNQYGLWFARNFGILAGAMWLMWRGWVVEGGDKKL